MVPVMRTVEIGGLTITVRQRAFNEVIAYTDTPPPGLPGCFLIDEQLWAEDQVTTRDLVFFTDVPADVLLDMTESELAQLVKCMKETNPRFFRLRPRLLSLGTMVEEAGEKARQTS